MIDVRGCTNKALCETGEVDLLVAKWTGAQCSPASGNEKVSGAFMPLTIVSSSYSETSSRYFTFKMNFRFKLNMQRVCF